jgi:AcrR family transcriptional regulator
LIQLPKVTSGYFIMSSNNRSGNGRRRKFRNVTAAHPCPICGKPDQCSVSEDGDHCVCYREGEPSKARISQDGRTYWVHRLTPTPTPTEPRYSVADGGGRLADPDIRHEIYDALLQGLDLSSQHEDALKARGLKTGLRAAGYRSLPERRRYRAVRRLIEAGFEQHLPTVPGFFVAEREGRYWTVSGASGLLIPVRDPQDRISALLVRPDDLTDGGKYRWLSSKRKGGAGPGAPIHVPRFKGDKNTVRITEGALKADVATRLSDMLTLGLPGVGAWRRLPRLLQEIGVKSVRVALDADACRKRTVGDALHALTKRLLDRGFTVAVEVWDESDGKGIDDLLAADKQPELIEGEQVETVVSRIRDAARAADPIGGSAGPDATDESFLSALEIITKHFHAYYRPMFRRGAVLYSETHGRNISASEACFAATPQVIDALEMACDAPRSEHGVTRSALPKFFKTWAPVAWRGVLDSLNEEEQTGEVVGSAAEEFRATLAAGLHALVPLSYRHTKDGESTVERRSLLGWAGLFAKSGTWQSVRNYLLWCRRDEAGLRVALRVGLFSSGQAYQRSLAEMNQYRFAQLCELYGAGTGQRAGGQRVVELSSEFLAELVVVPGLETAAETADQSPPREPGEEG